MGTDDVPGKKCDELTHVNLSCAALFTPQITGSKWRGIYHVSPQVQKPRIDT